MSMDQGDSSETIFPFISNFPIPEASDTERAYAAAAAGAYTTAIERFEALHSEGSRVVPEGLGTIFASGALGKKDMVKALEWWARAADGGNAGGEFNIGMAHLLGDGVHRDCAIALRHLEHAARMGHVGALRELGRQFLGGDCVPADHLLALFPLKWAESIRPSEDGQAMLDHLLSSAKPTERLALLKATEELMWIKPGAERRSESLRWFLHDRIQSFLTGQGRRRNPIELGRRPVWSPAEILRGWCERLSPVAPDMALLVLLSDRYTTEEPELLRCSTADLWELLEPGDGLFLTDGVTHHHTLVVEKDGSLLRTADPWPDDFLLLPGRNAIGAKAKLVEHGGYRLVEISQRDFQLACFGIAHFASMPLRESRLWQMPSIVGNPANVLSAAWSLCLHHWSPQAEEAAAIARSISPDSGGAGPQAVDIAAISGYARLLTACLRNPALETADSFSGLEARMRALEMELQREDANYDWLPNLHSYHRSLLAHRFGQAGASAMGLQIALTVILAEYPDGLPKASTPSIDRINLLAWYTAAFSSYQMGRVSDALNFASAVLMYSWHRRDRFKDYPFGGVDNDNELSKETLLMRMKGFASEGMYEEAISDAVSLVEWNIDVKAGLAGLDEYLRLSKRENTGNDFVDTVLKERRRRGEPSLGGPGSNAEALAANGPI